MWGRSAYVRAAGAETRIRVMHMVPWMHSAYHATNSKAPTAGLKANLNRVKRMRVSVISLAASMGICSAENARQNAASNGHVRVHATPVRLADAYPWRTSLASVPFRIREQGDGPHSAPCIWKRSTRLAVDLKSWQD